MKPAWKLGIVGLLTAGCVGPGGPPTAKYQQAYEDAVKAGATTASSDALALQSSYDIVRTCYDRGGPEFKVLRTKHSGTTVVTSQGERTVAQMTQECGALLEQLKKQAAEGCGAKLIVFESDVTGAGEWTKPAWRKSNGDSYSPIPCDKMAPSPASGELESLAEPTKEACKDATDFAFPSDWEYSKNDKGVAVHREATVACLFKGKRDDWDFYTKSQARTMTH